ncbi:MAG: hypothetical protein IJ040_07630 [Lachnospiraceae bacterium]|nr:hypothetical protein [Lachnospiraceae bacterium]
MNEQSYLDPEAIRQQSSAAVRQLGTDSTALETALMYVEAFIDNEDIQSVSFGNLKVQMEGYKSIIQGLLISMQLDATDHFALQNEVGNEVLDGAEILMRKEEAWNEIQQDEQMIEFYKNQMQVSQGNPIQYEYYSWLVSKYKLMLELDEKTYQYYQKKEDKYDEIESKTVGLFQNGREVRELVTEGLKELGTTFCAGMYTGAGSSVWRFALGNTGKAIPSSEAGGLYKQKLIDAFEVAHPEIAKKFNELLNDKSCEAFSQGDILEIKYLAYTAEEPCRTLFLNKLGTYRIVKIYEEDSEEGSEYIGFGRRIFLNAPEELRLDKRGAYNTFFHECGHATDMQEFMFYSHQYQYTDPETGEMHTLYELIEEDVNNNIREHIYAVDPYLTDSQIEQVLQSIQNGGEENQLKNEELIYIRQKILEQYNLELTGPEMDCVCDVYGGYTNLNIDAKGGYGHRPENGQKNYYYWYNIFGQPTYKQSSELWAEYFSYQMTGDEENLRMLRQYYPKTSEALDAMAEDLLQRSGGE